MKHIATVTLAISLAFGSAACSKGPDVDKLAKLKDEACACKDKACAEAANKKLDDALDEMGKGGKEPDEATAKKIMEVMTEAGLCIAKHQK